MSAALFLSLALVGQDPCERRPASEACDLARFEASLAKLPVPSIEDEAKAGAEIYRGRVLDAWSSPKPVVSFERRPGQAPMVVVRGYGGATVSGPVPKEVWDRVTEASVFADRDLAPTAPPPARDDQILEEVCLDGRTAMVEMANARVDRGDHRAVRRRVSGSCATDLTTTFIDSLPALAVASLPACAALTAERGDGYRLRECLSLKGDTLAAADLLNATREHPDDDMSVEAWRKWLQINSGARLDWAGETVTQRGFVTRATEPSIAGFVAEKAAALGGLSLYSGEVGAEDPEHGWTTGMIAYEDANGHQIVGNYRQVWSKANGGWSLVSWTVEPFKPLE